MKKYHLLLLILCLSACASTNKAPKLTKAQQQEKVKQYLTSLNDKLKKAKLAAQQRELAQYQANLCLSDEQYQAEKIADLHSVKNNKRDIVDIKSTVVKTIQPRTPRNAQNGYILASYVINEQGCYTNIKITSGYPKGVYDQVLVTALRQWKNNPAMLNGKAVKVKDKIQIDFSDEPVTKTDAQLENIMKDYNNKQKN